MTANNDLLPLLKETGQREDQEQHDEGLWRRREKQWAGDPRVGQECQLKTGWSGDVPWGFYVPQSNEQIDIPPLSKYWHDLGKSNFASHLF